MKRAIGPLARVLALTVLAAACQPLVSPPSAAATSAPASPRPTIKVAGPTQILTPSASATAAPQQPPSSSTPTAEQYEITAKDNGKTFVYTLTSRFSLILDQQRYPKESLKVACRPEGVVGAVSNVPAVAAPLWVVRYEGVKGGECTLADGDFAVTIRITDAQSSVAGPTQSPGGGIQRRLTEDALRNAEYTLCGDKVRLHDGEGITEKPGLDYARQCKIAFGRYVLSDLNGDRFADAVVILYVFERSHRIPSAHLVVDADGKPAEDEVHELVWETEVTGLEIANQEVVVTVAGYQNKTPETVRFPIK